MIKYREIWADTRKARQKKDVYFAMTFTIHTLGCKVNQYESTVMSEALEEAGLSRVESVNADDICDADKTGSARAADICIINSCAVTAESERKARQLIRRMINENPNTYVIVTGCYAQLRAEEILKIDGVSYVCGNFAKTEAVNAALLYASSGKRTVGINVPPLEKAKFEPSVIKHSERTRAYVKVEDGCDSKCAYCTIKDARGPVRSKSAADVHSEIAALADSGYREVVLTGIEVSAWGKDLYSRVLSEKRPNLADLILSLEDIDRLDRVRLSSLDPSLLTPAFTDRLKDSSKLCHHFHLSLQSGCDRTLADMRRRYNTAMIKRNVEHIREIFGDAEFTADTIVGFPGESDEDFEQTKQFISGIGLIYNHIFPFSRRPNTPAYDMDGQIEESVKSKRLHELEKIRDESREKICTGMIGGCVSVLFERNHGGTAKGHTASFIEVSAKSDVDLRGRMGLVKITGYDGAAGLLVGELVSLDV